MQKWPRRRPAGGAEARSALSAAARPISGKSAVVTSSVKQMELRRAILAATGGITSDPGFFLPIFVGYQHAVAPVFAQRFALPDMQCSVSVTQPRIQNRTRMLAMLRFKWWKSRCIQAQ